METAPQSLRDDLAVIHKFLGVEEGATLTTEQHETWARGFEAYLMEGKAPSLELADAFSRFKSWLSRIYSSIKSLNVKITPEIREVMDRMLATDEQIEATRSDMEMKPLFSGGAPAGMSEADYKTYQRMARRSAEQAEQRLLERTMLKVRREKEAWFKAEKKAVREEVEASTNKKREYRLTEMLSNQRWLGETDQEIPDMQIDRDELVEIFGEGVLPEINRTRLGGKRAIYGKNAESPEAVADFFGFKSASEMIEVLQNTPKRLDAIATEVDRIMVERHGDPLNDGSIEEEATIAVHSEQQAQTSMAEARAMAKQLNRDTSAMKMKVYRQQARTMISKMNVREASRPAAFLKAERKAARDAENAWAKVARQGKGSEQALTEALQAKERQILNGFLYNESRAFEKELQRGREKMRGYSKKSVRAKLEGGYIEQIDALLERFDFRVRSQKQVQRSESLVQYADRMVEDGREGEMDIDSALLDESRRTHYTKLPVVELRGLFDTINNIDHMGRFKQKLVDAKRKRDFDETVDQITDNIAANMKKRKLNLRETSGDKIHRLTRTYLDISLSADTLLREMDGFEDLGDVYMNIKGPIDEGNAEAERMRVQAADNFEELYSVYSGSEKIDMAKPKSVKGANRTISKWDAISLALNMGNKDNKQRILDPKNHEASLLTQAELDAILDTLDKRDWDFVKSSWTLIGEYWPMISAREARRTGNTPKKVEPIVVMTKFGPIEGGYYPIKYDPRLDLSAAKDAQEDASRDMLAGRYAKAATKNGHTKERAKSSGGRTIRWGVEVMHLHIGQVIHDLTLGEAVNNANKILTDRRIFTAFSEVGRSADLDSLKLLWLPDVATGPTAAPDAASSILRGFKNNFTLSKLAFNVSTMLVQLTGLAQSTVVIGPKYMARGTSDYVMAPRRWREDIKARSSMMAERDRTFQKDIYDRMNDLSMQGPMQGRLSQAREVYADIGFYGMKKIQFHGVDMPTWLGAYYAGMDKFNNDEERAVFFADRMVERSQGSAIFANRTAFERGTLNTGTHQSNLVKIFGTLGSYMFAKFNIAYELSQKTKLGISKAETKAEIALISVDMAINVALLFTLEAVVYNAIKGTGPDDDESRGEWMLKESLASFFSGLPFARDMVGPVQGYGSGGAYGSMGDIVGGALVQFSQGKPDKAARRALAEVIGATTGLPTTASLRLIEGAISSSDGEDVAPIEFLMGRR